MNEPAASKCHVAEILERERVRRVRSIVQSPEGALDLGHEPISYWTILVELWKRPAGKLLNTQIRNSMTTWKRQKAWALMMKNSHQASEQKPAVTNLQHLDPHEDFPQGIGMEELTYPDRHRAQIGFSVLQSQAN